MKVVFAFLAFCCSLAAAAQSEGPKLLLNRYTLDSSGRAGTLHCLGCAPNEKISYKITKGKRWMRITESGQLELKNGTKKTQDRYEVTVQANAGGQKITTDFIVLKNTFVTNKVIAHRGAWKSKHIPENSLASLQEAFDLGCEGSEFDVHLSSDSVLLVHHDANIGKTYIERTGSDSLRKMALANGEPLPLVTDFLKMGMRQQKTKLVLELKPSVISSERGVALARKVLEEVRKARAEAWMIYISFDYNILKEIMRLDPFAQCAYLKGDISPEQLAADKMYGLDYNYGALQKNPQWIRQAMQLGLNTNVWTVNEEALMEHFLKGGIDCITTNEPELLLKKIAVRN